MITATEYFETWSGGIYSETEIMIGFAKLHVEAALKAAAEKVNLIIHDYDDDTDNEIENPYTYGDNHISVNKDSILNSYPLTSIK